MLEQLIEVNGTEAGSIRLAAWLAHRSGSTITAALQTIREAKPMQSVGAVSGSPQSRRLKILRFSPELLVGLLSMDGTRRVKAEGLPADAKIVAVNELAYFLCNQIAFKIESQEFDEVPDGHAIPDLMLTVSEVRDEPRRGLEFI
jgi:hypothetical protein